MKVEDEYMKIAFVVESLKMGGLEKVTTHIINALSDEYQIDLIVIKENTRFYQINKSINVIEGNIRYTFYEKAIRKIKRIFNNNFEKYHWKEIEYLSSLVEKNEYTYVIASDGFNSILVNTILRKSKMLNKVRFISWLHNDYNTYFNKYYSHYTLELIDSLKNSFAVVCLTDQDRLQYGQYNPNTVRIYNPLTMNSVKLSKLEKKEIVFVGRLVKEQKGLDYLLDIVEQLKDTNWKFRVVGNGVDQEWLQKEIKSRNLTESIILHGSVKENIEDIYANASIFISTSRWEGFGLVITEAMSCGLPVISFDNSGPREILDEGKFGFLIPKYDIGKFSDKIKELISKEDKLKEYSENSLRRSQDFSIELIKQEWIRILSN